MLSFFSRPIKMGANFILTTSLMAMGARADGDGADASNQVLPMVLLGVAVLAIACAVCCRRREQPDGYEYHDADDEESRRVAAFAAVREADRNAGLAV